MPVLIEITNHVASCCTEKIVLCVFVYLCKTFLQLLKLQTQSIRCSTGQHIIDTNTSTKSVSQTAFGTVPPPNKRHIWFKLLNVPSLQSLCKMLESLHRTGTTRVGKGLQRERRSLNVRLNLLFGQHLETSLSSRCYKRKP